MQSVEDVRSKICEAVAVPQGFVSGLVEQGFRDWVQRRNEEILRFMASGISTGSGGRGDDPQRV